MRPIPKKILIHTVTIKTPTGEKDRWGNVVYTDPEEIKFVRLESTTKRIQTKESQDLQLSTLMFYDCKNSNPNTIIFSQGQVITFNGLDLIVQIIEPLYDEKKLHHYELGLI